MAIESAKDSFSNVRIALVGLGDRGRTTLRLLSGIEGAKVAALCDLSPANVRAAQELAMSCGTEDFFNPAKVLCADGPEAYLRVCHAEDVDLVYICSDWNSHTAIAVEALCAGKHVAVEVPAATTLEDIQLLVSTAQASNRQCFLLENVCFEQQVIDAIASIHRGDIGELVHAEGSYYHCLGDRWAPWRLDINRLQRGDLYPTHELGPISQALGIGVSDRLETLVCMDSAPLTGPKAYETVMHKPAPDFQNGDHTTTLIRTARGRTILLKHDVLTVQPYERQLTFIGTQGRITLNDTGKASHEQMTLNMNSRLIHCLRTGEPWDISLAELAVWCAVVPLSRLSTERGFAPVAFPEWICPLR